MKEKFNICAEKQVWNMVQFPLSLELQVLPAGSIQLKQWCLGATTSCIITQF